MEKRVLYLVLAVSVLFLASCKKNETTEDTKLYLNGVMLIDGDYSFVEVGNSFELRVSGVSHPKASSSATGHRLGLYYKITGLMDSYDTLYNATVNPLKDPVDVTIPIDEFALTDTLGTFTLSVYVYPEDSENYYSSSSFVSVTTIDYERSIPELVFNPDLPYVTDDRGLIPLSYNYAQTDENGNPLPNAWLTRNMSYLETGTGYLGVDDASYLLGRYYTYEEALTACPKGWKLPSDEDWAALANAVASTSSYQPFEDFKSAARHFKKNVRFNGNEMWEFWPEAPAYGTSGLCIIPTGYCNAAAEKDFTGYMTHACFWTSDENPNAPEQAYYRYFVSGDDDVKLGSADKGSMGMSVRCIAE